MSIQTQTNKRLYRLFKLVHLVLTFAPLATYSIIALINAESKEKLILGMTLIAVLIMTVVSIANQIVLKSRLWILLIGFYVCLDYIMTPLIIIACCQVVDELFICPLKNNFQAAYKTNKILDKRL